MSEFVCDGQKLKPFEVHNLHFKCSCKILQSSMWFIKSLDIALKVIALLTPNLALCPLCKEKRWGMYLI